MSEFEYKVSIIVPIYNMEKFLAGCLDSLLNQTMDKKDMEILCINDGSPDGSKAIQEEYAAKYSCIKNFYKENEGLSPTRNYGIARAKGKYIMYIDADDTITPETVKSVTDFFDKHYDEIDLVTYKELPVIDGEYGKAHFRYGTLKKSGVYDLTKAENAFVNQTRVNVCVKNLGDDNVLFDPDRYFRHEDQKYCIQVLQRKMKIGYCNKGLYEYLHQPDSIVRTFFYAYYIFEKTMKFWEDTFAYYGDEPVPYYIQGLYMNDLSWKTITDILLPYHYNEEDFAKAKGRIIALLNKVDDVVILNHPGMDNFHKQFFINLKENNEIKVLSGPKDLVVTNHDKVIYALKSIEIVIRQFKIKGDKVKVMGMVKSALFNYLEKPKLYMIKNGKSDKAKEIAMRDSSWSYYRAKLKTNNFWVFNVEIDTKKVQSFEFQIEVAGTMYKTSCVFMQQVIFSAKHKRMQFEFEGKNYKFGGGVFTITEATPEEIAKSLQKKKAKYKKSLPTVWKLRNKVLKTKRYNNVWLYHDCKGVEKDNAFYQFEHDFEMNDGVERFYVINEEDFVTARNRFPKKYHKNMIQFGSQFHKLLYIKARKVITAYVEVNNYSPFPTPKFQRYIDIATQHDLVYLQHGVLHAHVPWKYSLDRLGVDKEVISTHFEKKNLMENYCFQEVNLICSGMPRYDHMDLNQKSVNRILFAPSWRKYLVGMVGSEWITTESKFLQSQYFEETSKFLNSKELEEMLEKYDFYLDFKLHPILRRYEHLYKITNKRVTMAEQTVKETEYKIFMTDFSSFVFDFVYLEKPIIYFMPDYEMFRSGMNDYRELDMPFEDAFGDLALDADQAIASVKKLLENDCKPEAKYAEKMKDFFFHKDDKQVERIYQALIED